MGFVIGFAACAVLGTLFPTVQVNINAAVKKGIAAVVRALHGSDPQP